MRLEALLRAHGFMRVERPPQLWAADTDEAAFIALLGEMIAASCAGGAALEELTLQASNVTLPQEDGDAAWPPAGDYVAVTVSGAVAWEAEAVWMPEKPWPLRSLQDLGARLAPARARFAYTRRMGSKGSVTIFLARLW